jgi:uncharacterized protein YggU (UPF0235/DUF167 family)
MTEELLLPIRIVPKSSKNALVGWEGTELKIKIKAPSYAEI